MKTCLALAILFALAPFPLRCEEPAAGVQTEEELQLSDGTNVPYLLYLPKDYDGTNRDWPLVLFLHGRGESNGPLRDLTTWGFPQLIDRGQHFPFLVLSPQCPPAPDTWSSTNQQTRLLALLDRTIADYRVDTNRIYLTGISMGGTGSWRLAAAFPRRFAALIPIAGTGKTNEANQLKDLPIWVWHGVADRAVPVQHAIDMVAALRKAGNTNVCLTTLEGIGHDAWDAAYHSPDFYRWLAKQTRAKRK